MTLPLYMFDAFGHATGLVIAVALGFGFGFVLERAGFGRATILAAQFYFKDMRVLKVMFSAIVTALLGMTILSGVGVLDISAISIPKTYLWPQLFGGLLLGMGFIVSGYCPGTGVVGMASGKIDGLFAILGVMLGSIIFGFAYPWVAGFYMSGDLGVLRLPGLLGIPQAVLALGVTLMAVGAFIGGEKLEQKFASGQPPAALRGYAPLRRAAFVTLVIVAVVGMATLAVPPTVSAPPEKQTRDITSLELAQLAIERSTAYFLVDLREEVADDKRIVGSLTVGEGSDFIADLPATRMLIVYCGDGSTPLPDAVHRFEGDVAVLAGGYAAFERDVLTAPTLPDHATTDNIREFRLRSAVHAHFTGASLRDAPPPAKPKKQIRRAGKKEGGC